MFILYFLGAVLSKKCETGGFGKKMKGHVGGVYKGGFKVYAQNAPSMEEWPTKAKEVPSPHKVRPIPLATNPVFQCVRF